MAKFPSSSKSKLVVIFFPNHANSLAGNRFFELEDTFVENSGKNVNDEVTIDFTAEVALKKYKNFRSNPNRKEK